MSRSKKIILGIATFWPILYMVIFFLFVFSQFFTVFSSSEFEGPPTGFLIIFGLHFLTIVLLFILLFIYVRNVFKNERISQDKKALWAVVLFFGNFIAMPIYWYLYIWKKSKMER